MNTTAINRRRMMLTSLASGVLPCFTNQLGAQETTDTPLAITVAGYPYERVRALKEGRAGIEGCDITFETDKIGPLNRHIFGGQGTRDVSEVGLIPFLLAFCNDDFRDYQLLPIFVLKVFRHKSIFVRSDAGINQPEDLRGRRVATVGYSSSGLTWIRGLLKDEYNVTPEDLKWVMVAKDSAQEQTGGASKWEKLLPDHLTIEQAGEGEDESSLLIEGKVDAILHPAEPQAYVDRHPRIKRLFPDARSVESDYFRKTGIYPIMHAVAVRRDQAIKHPWLPRAIFEGYVKSRNLDYEQMRKILWAYSSLPWFGQEFEETSELMGDNFYSYGIEKNRKALETVFRYLADQGLANRTLTIDEVFGTQASQWPDG